MKRGRPSLITKEMEDFIIEAHLTTPRPTAKEIYLNFVETFEKGKDMLPSEAAIIKKITAIRKEVKNTPPDPKDQPWSIGSCSKYPVPPDIIPMLIEYQRLLKNVKKEVQNDPAVAPGIASAPEIAADVNKFLNALGIKARVATADIRQFWHIEPIMLTIRESLWFCRLYQVVKKTAGKKYPDDPATVAWILIYIAGQYASKERVAEIRKQLYPDTSELDEFYFIEERISLHDFYQGFMMAKLPREDYLKWKESAK